MRQVDDENLDGYALADEAPDPLPWSAGMNMLYLKMTDQAWRDLTRGGKLAADALTWFEGGCPIVIEHPRTKRLVSLSLVEVWNRNPRETIERARALYSKPYVPRLPRRKKEATP